MEPMLTTGYLIVQISCYFLSTSKTHGYFRSCNRHSLPICHSGHLGKTSTKDSSLVSIVHSTNMAAGLLSFESHGND